MAHGARIRGSRFARRGRSPRALSGQMRRVAKRGLFALATAGALLIVGIGALVAADPIDPNRVCMRNERREGR